MPHTLIGRRIGGRYDVTEKVGDGGMAIVYVGQDVLLARPVAIKVLRRQFASDKAFLHRFRMEARAAASLSHANVVNIYDIGEEQGTYFIVMEYIAGETLKQRIHDKGRLDFQETVHIAWQISKALRAAHGSGLVHRDIKPHNILVNHEGTVKVTDFGIARAASSASLTETGMLLGSVHYFSPEQARGDDVDATSDLYALGVVMYEMLTGRPPFSGESAVAVALQHLQAPPPSLRQKVPDIPPELERVVHRLMAKSKWERYNDAAEVTVALQALLQPAADQWARPTPIAGIVTNDGPASGGGPAKADDIDSMPTVYVTKQMHTQTLSTPPSKDGAADGEDDVTTAAKGDSGVPETNKRPRRKRRGLVLAIFLVFFAAAMASALYLPDIIFPPEVDVPDLIGLDTATAQAALQSRKLKLIEEGRMFHAEIERGKIIRQSPNADHRVRMGREIKVVVSSGPEQVMVPDFVGQQKIAAELTMTMERLTLGEVDTQFVSGQAPNIVLEQSPEPGLWVDAGSSINIVVSRDAQQVRTIRMPDVKGVPLPQAMALLSEIGFTEGQLHAEPHPTASENEVIDQNPAVGEEVEFGFPYALAYAVRQSPDEVVVNETAQSFNGSLPEDKHWENTLLINVPDGPAQEVVVVVVDDWGPRQVFREVKRGGSRFYHTVRLRGDMARIQVWFDGDEQLNRELQRPGANS